jgi:hypothetical protein
LKRGLFCIASAAASIRVWNVEGGGIGIGSAGAAGWADAGSAADVRRPSAAAIDANALLVATERAMHTR